MHPLHLLRRIEQICSQFEKDGRWGGSAVQACIESVEPSERNALAEELIPLDAELRLSAGHTPTATDYQSAVECDGVDLTLSELQQLISQVTRHASGNQPEPPSETEQYRFLERIGRGAYGDVWRVDDKLGQRSLAVKVLRASLLDDPNASERLLREALLTGRLQHPSIPPVYDRGTLPEGTTFYSMKLVGGETFESILQSRSEDDRELPRCLAIFEQLAQTVAYAHAQGVIHRDLKPHNVMVGDFGEVQVMDWGMAKSLDERDEPSETFANLDNENWRAISSDDTAKSLTTDGDVLGTPAYMSPEQARGEKENLDARADVFSLGAILFQVLTNQRIHQHLPPLEAVRRTATGQFADALSLLDANDLHADLTDLCRRCLAASPDDRPAGAGEISAAITEHLVSAEKRARQAEIERREGIVQQTESTRRRRLQLMALSAIAVVSIVGAAAAFWQRNEALRAQAEVVDALEVADQRLEQAQDVVEEFFLTVSDDQGPLARAAGAQAVRQELIEKARDYYREFLEESGGNPRLQLKIAKTYVRLADILKLVSPGESDQVDYATSAIEICSDLLRQDSQNAEAVKIKASAYAVLCLHYYEIGQQKAAIENIEMAIDQMRQLVRMRGTAGDRFGLAKYLQIHSVRVSDMGDHERSAELCGEAIEIGSSIQKEDPENVEYLHQLGRMRNSMAILYAFRLGKQDQGMAEFERAIECSRRGLELQPTRPDIQEDLSLQQMNLAMVQTHARQLDKARESFEGAIAAKKILVEQNPDVPNYRASLALAHGNFATFCLMHLKRIDLAAESMLGVVENRRVLVEQSPNIDRYRDELIISLNVWIADTYHVEHGERRDPPPPQEFAAETITEIQSLLAERAQRPPNQAAYQRKLQYWALVLDPEADPRPMLELTGDAKSGDAQSRKKLKEQFPVYRALALLRDGRHEEAAELLGETKPKKTSLNRRIVTALTQIPSDPEAAETELKKIEPQLFKTREITIDNLILFDQALRRLASLDATM